MKLVKLLMALLLVGGVTFTVGCDDDVDDADDVGREMEDAADDAGDAMEDAADDVGDALDD